MTSPTHLQDAAASDATDGHYRCAACREPAVEVFHEQWSIPVSSNRLFSTREEARNCERGDLRLGLCHACGLIANVAFTSSAVLDDYESSQASSPRFREYAASLAGTWVERHDLRGATVLEIGCGRGEFLAILCGLTGGHGIGVDPVLAEAPPAAAAASTPVEWVPERYEARHLAPEVRAIVCRHTLEHLPDVGAFLAGMRASIGARDLPLLLEVPDVLPILRANAFWDVYYEHCVYFSVGSLTRLLRRAGFEVTHTERTYDGQYLVVDARPTPQAGAHPGEDDRDALWDAARAFRSEYLRRVSDLRGTFEGLVARGQRIAFWGAGSKATAYLTALGRDDLVECVVDINPRKQGSFIAGTGHPVVAPEQLREVRPDVVVMMNPVYRAEIAAQLASLGVDARLVDPGAA